MGGQVDAADRLDRRGPFDVLPGEQSKAVSAGIADAWRIHVLWWWVLAQPAVAALLVRWRWPLLAFILAMASAAPHQLHRLDRG